VSIHKSTTQYERWLGRQLTIVRKDLNTKHERMSTSAFSFFRGTFYRWAEVIPTLLPELMKAPAVLGVGDVHIENFGTWRDGEGRLVWGINDFDEACRLPYTCDLVRLATSVVLAHKEQKISLSQDSTALILDGYCMSLAKGGRAFVLAEHHQALWEMAVHRLHEPEQWWEKLTSCRKVRTVPRSAAKALKKSLPELNLETTMVHRVAGMGSLGRERFVAIAEWDGGQVAREAKALAPSAWGWAHPNDAVGKPLYKECVSRAVRSADPFLTLKRRWIIRRLAPDCSRLSLHDMPREKDASRLLHAMGAETANVHLGSVRGPALLRDLKKRPGGWLAEAAEKMAWVVEKEWKEWG